MADGRTGDRVNLNPDDTNPLDTGQSLVDMRLDLPDAAAIQEFVQDTIVRTMGGLLGLASGVLTVPTLTAVVAADPPGPASVVLTIGSCLLFDAQSAGNNAVDGRVLRHVFGDPNQTSILDVTSMQAGGVLGVLWARRVEITMDQDLRKRWDVLSGVERSFAPNTRRRERVQFQATIGFATVPTAAAGTEPWFPFARITAWSGGGGAGSAPTLRAISVWDGHGNAGADVGDVDTNLDLLAVAATGANFALVKLLRIMRTVVAAHLDSTSASAWNTGPTRGLSQLNTALSPIEAGLEQTGVIGSLGWYPIAVARIAYDGLAAANSYTTQGNKRGFSDVNIVRSGVGGVDMVFDAGTLTGYNIVAAIVTGEGNGNASFGAEPKAVGAAAPYAATGGVRVNILDLAAVLSDRAFMIVVFAEKLS